MNLRRLIAPRYQRTPIPTLSDNGKVWQNLGLIEQRSYSLGDIWALTATYTVVPGDGLLLGDASGGAFAVTLPLAANVPGQQFMVKKTDSSGNAVTVTAHGSDTIDGSSTYSLPAQYDVVTIRSDGANWWVL